MEQTFGSGEDFNKCSKINDPFYLAEIYLIEFDFSGNTADYLHGLFGRFSIRGSYIDEATVVYIYLHTCLFNNTTDNLSARTYDIADFVLLDLHCVNPRCIGCKIFSWSSYCFSHLVKDIESALPCLLKSLFHYLMRYTPYLRIQLECCNPFVSAGHFEVHVSKMIFKTQNISENNDSVTFLYKPHCYTCNMSTNRDTCIHQRKRATTY